VGKGVRVGAGLGVTEIVAVGRGVLDWYRVGDKVIVGVFVGCVGVDVKESTIPDTAVLISKVGGRVVAELLFAIRNTVIAITQIKPIANTPIMPKMIFLLFMMKPSQK
jgi:hypothetical protein